MVARSRRARGCAIITGSRTQAGRRYWIYREGVIGDGRGGRARLVHPRAVRLMPEYTGFARKKLVLRRAGRRRSRRAPFVELGVTSPSRFLRGASDAIELVLTALELGMDAIGIADRNTLAGVVRMHSAARARG